MNLVSGSFSKLAPAEDTFIYYTVPNTYQLPFTIYHLPSKI
jgi:hypothetical protein